MLLNILCLRLGLPLKMILYEVMSKWTNQKSYTKKFFYLPQEPLVEKKNYGKSFLLRDHISIHKFNIIYLPETFLNLSRLVDVHHSENCRVIIFIMFRSPI